MPRWRTFGITWNEQRAPRHPHHALVLLGCSAPLLSSTAKISIENPDNRKLVTLPVVGRGHQSRSEKVGTRLVEPFVSESGNCPEQLELLAITFEHTTMVESLALHHKDPFDRLLVAQTMIERPPS